MSGGGTAKLQEVAAKIRGGNPASYTVANGKVGSLTFAEVAKKAIELGGTDDGPPGDRGDNYYGAYFRDLDGNKLNFHCWT